MKHVPIKRIASLLSSLSSYWKKKRFVFDRNVYIFMPINGAGLGHLTRSLAIAKRLREKNPDCIIIFFTTSIAVSLVNQFGFICYHIPPAALTRMQISDLQWNLMLRDALTAVIRTYRPATLVFDGTSPYLGLRLVMRRFGHIRYVWVRRELFKQDVDHSKVEKFSNLFDLTLVPGEVGEDPGESTKRLIKLKPVTLLDKEEILSRKLAREVLRLDELDEVAYIQLGAGNINGITDIEDRIISILHECGVKTVLGRSPIALSEARQTQAHRVITDYPNAKYFSAFDFAVMASGYNSVTEAVSCGLPTLFIPNPEAKADDQLRRANNAKSTGSHDVMLQLDVALIKRFIKLSLFSSAYCRHGYRSDGASQAAELLLFDKAMNGLESAKA